MKSLPVPTPAQLAVHLQSLRRARGLTQAKLGALVGLDQTRIAKIEGDPLRVSVGQLMKVLSALRVRLLLEQLPDKGRSSVKEHSADW
jgi:HTH-type transcriptional regulator / antitoxin HipB